MPPVPLDWCGAQTQGTIGAMLLNAVERSLAARGVARPVAALVTRTAVDPTDPHFVAPSKPIGRYLPEAEAQVMIEHGQVWQDRGERGWRRVVASPEPLEMLDAGRGGGVAGGRFRRGRRRRRRHPDRGRPATAAGTGWRRSSTRT